MNAAALAVFLLVPIDGTPPLMEHHKQSTRRQT